jgi:hypothetical protein
MSNRFHTKFHRHNHHTVKTEGYPDSSWDPIASRESAFQGEFYSDGDITTTANISAEKDLGAYNGTFHGDMTIGKSLTVNQNFSVYGELALLDTTVRVLSSVSISNTGIGPALLLRQTGQERVVQIFHGATPALVVDARYNRDGYVGIGTELPNEALTIVGNVSATGREDVKSLYSKTLVNTPLLSSPNILSYSIDCDGGVITTGNLYASETVRADNLIVNNDIKANKVNSVISVNTIDFYSTGFYYGKLYNTVMHTVQVPLSTAPVLKIPSYATDIELIGNLNTPELTAYPLSEYNEYGTSFISVTSIVDEKGNNVQKGAFYVLTNVADVIVKFVPIDGSIYTRSGAFEQHCGGYPEIGLLPFTSCNLRGGGVAGYTSIW